MYALAGKEIVDRLDVFCHVQYSIDRKNVPAELKKIEDIGIEYEPFVYEDKCEERVRSSCNGQHAATALLNNLHHSLDPSKENLVTRKKSFSMCNLQMRTRFSFGNPRRSNARNINREV